MLGVGVLFEVRFLVGAVVSCFEFFSSPEMS